MPLVFIAYSNAKTLYIQKVIKHLQELQKNLILLQHVYYGDHFQLRKYANISSGPKLFQLICHKDKSITDDLIDRCSRAILMVCVLTVDTLVAGNRERDHRTGFTTPPKFTLESLISFAMRPGWVFNYFTNKKFELANIAKKN